MNSHDSEAEQRIANETEEPSADSTPDGLATDACANCGSTLPPDTAGLCPVATCRGFRKRNRLAVKHDGRSKFSREDIDARNALAMRLYLERGGRDALDIVSQLRIEDYATAQIQLGKVTRRLETLGAVSSAGNERKSLTATYATFSARAERLAAELPPVVPRTSEPVPTIESLSPDELVAVLEHRLEQARQLRDQQAKPPEPIVVMTTEPEEHTENAATTPEPEATPEIPPCEFCHGPCVRESRPDLYPIFHLSDPQEIARRNEALTATMYRQVRFGHRGLY